MMPKSEVAGKCGCGRSPTGLCCGWHALTEEAYRAKLAESKDVTQQAQTSDELEAYRQQAMDLWFDAGGSCTGSSGTPNIN
jgi:predicted RNase H-like HicB family nuclease